MPRRKEGKREGVERGARNTTNRRQDGGNDGKPGCLDWRMVDNAQAGKSLVGRANKREPLKGERSSNLPSLSTR